MLMLSVSAGAFDGLIVVGLLGHERGFVKDDRAAEEDGVMPFQPCSAPGIAGALFP